jgi:transposase
LRFVAGQVRQIEATWLARLEQQPEGRAHAMVRLLARVIGVGVETADMLVQEVFSRNLRDRRAVARYAGLTGSPDESGIRRREKGLARAGNARARCGMIQLAWRFVIFQKGRCAGTMVSGADCRCPPRHEQDNDLALARKLLVALWRIVTIGHRVGRGSTVRTSVTWLFLIPQRWPDPRSVRSNLRWWRPELQHGQCGELKNGPTVSEPRHRCV